MKTNIGSPQGDGMSGIFFNIALENALRTLRVELNEKNQAERSSLPTVNEEKTEDKVIKRKKGKAETWR